MRKRLIAASAAFVLGPLSAAVSAAISVEQIEAYESTTSYAPVDFGGNATVTPATGQYMGITFHAVDTTKETLTLSTHAMIVANNMFGAGNVGYQYVTDEYDEPYDSFYNDIVLTQNNTGSATAPGNFSAGVQVVNTSYIADYGNVPADTDALRRIDFIVNRDDVTLVVGAVGDGTNLSTGTLNWSCFNTLSVTGTQSFSAAGGPGKQHADLYYNSQASFSASVVSGDVIGLYGIAQTAALTDAQHSYVMRSLMMAGADKGGLSHQASNSATGALDPFYGAGTPDYDRSLQILQAGEKTPALVASNAASGTLYTTQEGWASANISAGHQSVVLFNSSNAITGLTASLNWNVTSASNSSHNTINTASVIFPNLTLEVRPVTLVSGSYQIGASLGNYTLLANVANDNVQYLWANTSLAAGNYAFVITGDATKTATVGFSYTLAGSFASQWNSSAGSSWGTAANWTNGIPNGQAAQANFLASPGLTTAGTITLGSDRTVGQLTFNNPNSYTISASTGGVLIIDDTGDSSGIVTPTINVLAGNQIISAPVSLISGVTTNIAAGSALNITGALTGSGGLTKAGSGTLTLNNTDIYGTTTINAGTLIFAASSTGIAQNTQSLTINAGGAAALAASPVFANRQLLIASALSIAGSSNSWSGRLDLNNNDLDVSGGNLATITNQVKQGYNNGNWNSSNGIISSSAGSDTTHLTALGVIQNNQSGVALFTSSTPFDGNTALGASDILVKYTYYGDANLDGKVDGSDYSLIDNGYLMHATGWFNGDFNYDGVVNGSDYTLIDNAFNTQGARLAAIVASPNAVSTTEIADTSAVPEPTAMGTIGVVSSVMLGRRQRRSAIKNPRR